MEHPELPEGMFSGIPAVAIKTENGDENPTPRKVNNLY